MTRLFERTDRFWTALVVVFVCGGFGASAQKSARPNLSGTWVMETADRSHDLSEKDFIIERTSPTPSDITLKISDDGNDIKVLRTFVMGAETREQTLEYHTDGRGETNPAVASQRTLVTRTRWKRDHLLIRFDQFTASVSGRPVAGYREIEWRLVEGGTKLLETDTTRYQESNTIDSSVSASDMRQPSILPPSITVRRVYKKQS
jgi:hypothetical protein